MLASMIFQRLPPSYCCFAPQMLNFMKNTSWRKYEEAKNRKVQEVNKILDVPKQFIYRLHISCVYYYIFTRTGYICAFFVRCKRLLIAKLLGIQSSLPFLFLQVSQFSLRMGIFFKVVVKEIFSSNSYFIIFTTHSIAFIASSHKGINCIDWNCHFVMLVVDGNEMVTIFSAFIPSNRFPSWLNLMGDFTFR